MHVNRRRPVRRLGLLVTLLVLAATDAARGRDFAVTSTSNSGAGSLRQAILAGSSRLPPLKAAIVSQLTGRRPAWPTVAP